LSLHELENSKHYDLFLEQEDFLVTLEISFVEKNFLLSGNFFEFHIKPPHRKIYLDYEGEISNNRGRVQVVWRGFWEVQDLQDKRFVKFLEHIVKFN
ncbi:MAG: hypothetical protein QXO70_04320, partial [Candidatus Pacearchaeota archaeon]